MALQAIFAGPDDSETCDGCEGAVNNNPYSVDDCPEPGDFECMSKCRHMVQIIGDNDGEVDAFTPTFDWTSSIGFTENPVQGKYDYRPSLDDTPGYTPIDNTPGYTALGDDAAQVVDEEGDTILDQSAEDLFGTIPDLLDEFTADNVDDLAEYLFETGLSVDDTALAMGLDDEEVANLRVAYAKLTTGEVGEDVAYAMLQNGNVEQLTQLAEENDAFKAMLQKIAAAGFDDAQAAYAYYLSDVLGGTPYIGNDGRWYLSFRESMREGGEGSGYRHHPGNPGHVGGSVALDKADFDKTYKRWDDNPGNSQWLAENPTTLTAGYNTDIPMPSKWVASLPGLMGEETRIKDGDETVVKIAANMKSNGYDATNPITVEIDKNGTPRIFEGNHRARAAVVAGIENVPTSFRFLGGGETKFHPYDAVFKKMQEGGAGSGYRNHPGNPGHVGGSVSNKADIDTTLAQWVLPSADHMTIDAKLQGMMTPEYRDDVAKKFDAANPDGLTVFRGLSGEAAANAKTWKKGQDVPPSDSMISTARTEQIANYYVYNPLKPAATKDRAVIVFEGVKGNNVMASEESSPSIFDKHVSRTGEVVLDPKQTWQVVDKYRSFITDERPGTYGKTYPTTYIHVRAKKLTEGGPGSGDPGHKGVPGQVGGSAPGNGPDRILTQRPTTAEELKQYMELAPEYIHFDDWEFSPTTEDLGMNGNSGAITAHSDNNVYSASRIQMVYHDLAEHFKVPMPTVAIVEHMSGAVGETTFDGVIRLGENEGTNPQVALHEFAHWLAYNEAQDKPEELAALKSDAHNAVWKKAFERVVAYAASVANKTDEE
jgi:hypothetical protein